MIFPTAWPKFRQKQTHIILLEQYLEAVEMTRKIPRYIAKKCAGRILSVLQKMRKRKHFASGGLTEGIYCSLRKIKCKF